MVYAFVLCAEKKFRMIMILSIASAEGAVQCYIYGNIANARYVENNQAVRIAVTGIQLKNVESNVVYAVKSENPTITNGILLRIAKSNVLIVVKFVIRDTNGSILIIAKKNVQCAARCKSRVEEIITKTIQHFRSMNGKKYPVNVKKDVEFVEA